MDALATLFESQPWLGKLIAGVIIVAVTAAITQVVVTLIRRVLNRDDTPLPSSTIFINIVRAALWLAGIAVLLQACFGIDATAIVAGLGVAGIALSLGLQDTISNLIGGLQVSLMHLSDPGEIVSIGGNAGKVKDVTWRHTLIETQAGTTVIIPNSVVSKGALENLSDTQWVLVPIVIPLSKCSEEFYAQIVDAAERGVADVCAPGLRPLLLLAGSTVDGDGMKANIKVFSNWQLTDGALIDRALHEVTPLLQRAWNE